MNNNFMEMLEEYLPTKEQNLGDKIEGTIIRKDNEFGYLNIQNKLEGRIRVSEIEGFEIGDKVKVLVVKENDEFLIVSKNILEKKEAFSNIKKGDKISGIIKEKIKGGYKVECGLIKAFLPFRSSGLNQQYLPNGELLEFDVTEKNRKEIVISRLEIIKENEKNFLNKLNLGDKITGTISNKLDYGMIIDLGTLSGLLHSSEISWNKEKTLKDFTVGEKIDVKIIELDKETKKIKLSIKQLVENPWLKIREKYHIGQNIDAPVKEVFSFGVVVDLGDREDLIHVSDLYYKKIGNVEKEYKKGDVIFCEVIDINDEKEKIILSARTVFEKIWESLDDFCLLNDIINIKVTRVKDFGFFAKTDENLEIFVPKSEYSWNKADDLNIKVGDSLDVKLIEIKKEDKNLVGSIKRLGKSPYDIASSKFDKNTEYEVEITDILENGVLVRLTDDFKGLIPKKELSKEEIKDIKEHFNVGDKIKAVVFDKNNKNSILLSIKKIEELEEKKELEELMRIYGANN
ncbi:S1 RNA-binding domain-containing protein [Streptobacillus moniliformis]|uniref:S1 RNA-binding domain-containing protein n=1 Tax=Streptobacillus moniliformis TaxID=34105 RepID=UPI0007E3196E|nr:S1 RNA-binding domain-containing protein [Streptobacillus moniliformis]